MMLPIPAELYWMFSIYMRMIGSVICILGGVLLTWRLIQTKAHLFLPLPRQDRKIGIHKRRDGTASFLPLKMIDLEHLTAKNKLFKNTGGNFRIAGHDVFLTDETLGYTKPIWLGEYFHSIKNKYGIQNRKQLLSLAEKLRKLQAPSVEIKDGRPVVHNSLEEQLSSIEELHDIMQDPEKRQVLLNMPLYDLQNMAEHLYDGRTVHLEDVEQFVEGAAPNDLDTLVDQTVTHRTLQFRAYNPYERDWGKWALYFVMILIGGAVAYQIFFGGG